MSRTVFLMVAVAASSLLAGPPSTIRAQEANAAATDTPARRVLELTTSIQRERYCKEPDGGDESLHLDLQLSFRNVTSEPVILYRWSNRAYEQLISASASDAAAKRYLQEAALTGITQGLPEKVDTARLGEDFVVLSPGGTYTTVARDGGVVFLKTDGPDSNPSGFGPGDYVLQVGIATFPYPDDVASRLQTKWQGKGILASDGVISEPMPFTITANRRRSRCGD